MTNPSIRLAKAVVALTGCSRREAELYIEGGWVTVDGRIVEEPQFMVEPDAMTVALLPDAAPAPIEPVTIIMHKPPGIDADGGAGRSGARKATACGARGESVVAIGKRVAREGEVTVATAGGKANREPVAEDLHGRDVDLRRDGECRRGVVRERVRRRAGIGRETCDDGSKRRCCRRRAAEVRPRHQEIIAINERFHVRDDVGP